MPDIAAATAAAIKTLQDKSEADAAEKMEAQRMTQLRADIARQDREREARDDAEKERKRRLAQVEKDAAEAKAEQFRREEARKAQEFRDMKERNEARIEQQKKDREAIATAKTMRERVGLRQNIESRERSAAIPASSGLKTITPTRIKESIKKVVGKAPAMIDRKVTNAGLGFLDTLAATRTPKRQIQFVKTELQQVSRIAKSHAKKPVTGGKVAQPLHTTPVVSSSAVMVNPNFMANLLGQQPKQIRKKVSGGLSNLDDFVRRL